MEITKSFISRKFSEFNDLYFDGKLCVPEFEITHVRYYLGQYHWHYDWFGRMDESVIRISDKFDRTEDDICNTLLHEMIHLYIRQNKIRDTRSHHGKVFYSVADRINRQGGWHIARTDSIAGLGLRDKSSGLKFYMVCFENNTGKFFRFRITPKYLDYYERWFEMYPDYYRNVYVYISSDDVKYAHYRTCYRSIRGYYIDKAEFDVLRGSENLVYNIQTLGIGGHAA